MNNRDQIVEHLGEGALMLPTDYDTAIIGVLDDVVLYDEAKVVEVLMGLGAWDLEEANEFYEFNIKGSQGEGYPKYATLL